MSLRPLLLTLRRSNSFARGDTVAVNGIKVSKCEKIRNRYNQVPHLTQDTNGKVTNSQLDITNESQEVSPFPAGDHKTHINRRAQRQASTRQNKNIKDPQKKNTRFSRVKRASCLLHWLYAVTLADLPFCFTLQQDR